MTRQLNLHEVARHLGLPVAEVRLLLCRGELKSTVLGGQPYVRPDDLEASLCPSGFTTGTAASKGC